MKKILLTTLNARYTHTSIALRYLYANMHELQDITTIHEFTINDAIQSIAEDILDYNPTIVGIGVYIWNAIETATLIETLKKVSPELVIVLGGPEVSYLPFRVNFDLADYIVQGEGDQAFYALCKEIENKKAPLEQVIKPVLADLSKVISPYTFYSDDDIKNRYVYVEASRGCPFMCEFCLSSIDEKVRNFDIDALINEFELLWSRGVRSFKFIDRTFNLNMKFANKILDFFLSKEAPYFAHFEVIPDHFPESIKERIAQFPAGALQLEVGIQTLNQDVSTAINRPLRLKKIEENLNFLENKTKAHMHVDLIVGLPSETVESFALNLNQLSAMVSCEIQIGILKKLSGTTISRHDKEQGMVYSDIPPYDILKNNEFSFKMIQKMKRFARFWDLLYNSGNFQKSLKLLWPDGDTFKHFFDLSEWIYAETSSTWKISLDRLSKLYFDYLTTVKKLDDTQVAQVLLEDILKVHGRKTPGFLKVYERELYRKEQVHAHAMNKRQQLRT